MPDLIDDHQIANRPITLNELIQPGMDALRRLWLPFVLIQLCGCALVVGYYFVPSVTRACEWVAGVKAAGGYAFCAGVMAVAGGLVPELFKYVTGIDRSLTRVRMSNIAFAMCLFACSGVLAETFYRLMAWTFGDSNAPDIVASKLAIDQFVYTPTFGVGFVAILYAFRLDNYSVRVLLRQVSVRWYVRTVGPMLPPCWAYWIPMGTLLYILPVSLQFVFGAIGTSAANLIFIAVASRERK